MKTISLKKVSAVAVASLGFGLLSVVPANATTTLVTTGLGTITPADGSAVVGSNVVIPLTLITGTVDTNTTAFTATATFAQRPVNTALTSANIAASVTGNAATFAGTSAAAENVARAVPTANAIAYTFTATHAAVTTLAAAGSFSFTPDVPGVYSVTIDIPTGGTSVNLATITKTATAAIIIIVGGAGLTQATSGKGTATGTATTGGSAVVSYVMPGATAAGTRFNVTSSGVGSISNPVDCADDSAELVVSATLVRCTTGGSTTEGFINGVNGSEGVFFNNTTLSAGNVLTGASAQTVLTVDANSNVAGVQTILVTSVVTATGAPTTRATITITWGASPTLSVANSTVHKAAGTTAPTATTDADAIVVAATISTQRANILVTVKNSADAALNGQTIAAAISGPGLIAWDDNGTGDGTASGSVSYTADSSTNSRYLVVSGNGVGGVATITFSIGTTVLGTETITFYGAVAKYTATPNVNAVVGSATTDAVNVTATDAAGVVVPGATVYAYSSSTAVATVETSDTTRTTAIAETSTGVPGNYVSAKAIGTAGFTVTPVAATTATSVTITFGNAATLATSTVTTTAVVAIGAVEAATVVLTANKASYAPGEAVTLTLTYRDALGRLTGTNDGATLIGGAASSVGLGGAALPTAGALITKLGTKTYAVFAPLTGGPVTVTITSGTDATNLATAARSVASAVTFTVTDTNAAANAAANAALTTRIDSLNAKIVALTALIAKIMKSLKIK